MVCRPTQSMSSPVSIPSAAGPVPLGEKTRLIPITLVTVPAKCQVPILGADGNRTQHRLVSELWDSTGTRPNALRQSVGTESWGFTLYWDWNPSTQYRKHCFHQRNANAVSLLKVPSSFVLNRPLHTRQTTINYKFMPTGFWTQSGYF